MSGDGARITFIAGCPNTCNLDNSRARAFCACRRCGLLLISADK